MITNAPQCFTAKQWEIITSDLKDRPATVNDYRKVLNLFTRFDGGIYIITQMNREDAENCFRSLDRKCEEGIYSRNTIHRYKATLRAVARRMEAHQDLFPGFINPFSGTVNDEIRRSTAYTADMFAKPEDIRAVCSAMHKCSKNEQIILTLMMNLGLTPVQVSELKVSDFTQDGNHPDQIALQYIDGTVLEKTKISHKQSQYSKEGLPMTVDHTANDGTITWNYHAAYLFTPAYTEVLRSYISDLGTNTDSRPLFLSKHHAPNNYRSIHHLVHKVCQYAGIRQTVTPMQISLYGTVRAYMISHLQELSRNDTELLEQEANPERKAAIRSRIEKNQKLLKTIGSEEIIGCYENRFPLPKQQTIDHIISHISESFLTQYLI